MSAAETEPRRAYQERLQRHSADLSQYEQRSKRISLARLVVFAAGVLVGVAVFAYDALWAGWLSVPGGCFLVLVVLHELALRREQRARDAVALYESHLNRLEGRWAGTGNQRDDLVPADHPYAADLDLFGKGSLFELLCLARTMAGERMLAAWLTRSASPAEITQRQEAIDELRPHLDLREDLGLLAYGVRSAIEPATLVAWGQRAPLFSQRQRLAALVVAWSLTGLTIIATLLWALAGLGPLPLIALIPLHWITYRVLRGRLQEIIGAVQRPERDLIVLAGLLQRLETQPVRCSRLVELTRAMRAEGKSASRAIKRLQQLVSWLDWQKNALFAPVTYMLMWSVHFGLTIEMWRCRTGAQIEQWLRAVGEYEALCSLASYAYDHPEQPFAEITTERLLDGAQLRHPLLPAETCVANSVRLDAETSAWIISGSNMSGKSTLLRTVGVNVVLALAGAPVPAQRLRLCTVSLGASIRTLDSLQEGASRFYAEITRLKQLYDLTEGEQPLLFLLDEILHGTNSHDRRIGAVALLAKLLERESLGILTTHDLALAKPTDALDRPVANKHFTDTVKAGKLMFDYKLREGVAQGSNAITLMQQVGLPV